MNLDKIIFPPPGTYILAVSGGVDSMALLDAFNVSAKGKGYNLIVAHFDHGMRAESAEDATFVRSSTKSLGLMFETSKAQIKLKNEAEARIARYEYLKNVAKKLKANAIITAHHQDDLIETSLLNLARGSGRAGLVPFTSKNPLRPFQKISRTAIVEYAIYRKLAWREDDSNGDISNPRNFIRIKLLTTAPVNWKSNYLQAINELRQLNVDITSQLTSQVNFDETERTSQFSRSRFMSYSLEECSELLIVATKKIDSNIELDQRLVYELVLFGKTAKPGRKRPLRSTIVMEINRKDIIISSKFSAN